MESYTGSHRLLLQQQSQSPSPSIKSDRPMLLFDTFESDATLSPMPQDPELSTSNDDHMQNMEDQGKLIWSQISRVEDFTEKYGQDLDNPGTVHCYLFTRQPRTDTFAFEAFAAVRTMKIMKEELVYHSMFERLIERYTRSRAKPNPVLLETRSTDFCYRLTILVEAVPQNRRVMRPELRLLREYAVLHHLWECYRQDLSANGAVDAMVGIPMPFEFVNVVGYPEYDFTSQHGLWHRGLNGEEVPLSKVLMPGSATTGVGSTFSYMSIEKLGPSLQYIVDLLKSQRRLMSLSTALKVLDQLLSRLMVVHRYGVIMGNLDSKFIHFGVREAAKVLYINRFDNAVVAPTRHRSAGPYSERCASLASLRRREMHFVNDIESAYYVFLSLIFPALPWDESSGAGATPNSSWDSASANSHTLTSGRSTGAEAKANFWSSARWHARMMRHVNFEFQSDPVYQGFTVDLLTMLHARTLEAMAQFEPMSHAEFMTGLLTPTSVVNNAYGGLRRVIAAYFRFEAVASISRDPVCQKKLELLLLEDPEDRRILWNLNDWCWNAFYPTYLAKTRTNTVSMMF